MTALTGLIDALLAARLAPRLDVLGIKPEAAIGKPGAVVDVEKVANDVRLPSNAALDRVIAGAGSGLPPRADSGGSAPASIAMHMSQAARVIGAVLADLQAEPGPVRGAQPAVATPLAAVATAAALAGDLARTVAGSGLFYESHLAEFAAGSRSLAQMAAEPQARWSALPGQPAPAAAASGAATLPAVDAGATATAAAKAEVESGAAQALPRIAALPDALLPATAAPAAARAGAEASGAGAPTPSATTAPPGEAATHIENARLQAAYGWAEPAAATPAPATPVRQAEEAAVRHAAASAASAASAVSANGEVIHPQAVTLVHQQLDLLATSVFRWNGEAWPGVPMRWSIEEEKTEDEAEAPDAQEPRRWSTRVSIELPRLGAVELRLGIAGPGVHAHLAAGEAATLALLRADSGRLVSRFEAAGLRLQDLQLGAEVAP